MQMQERLQHGVDLKQEELMLIETAISQMRDKLLEEYRGLVDASHKKIRRGLNGYALRMTLDDMMIVMMVLREAQDSCIFEDSEGEFIDYIYDYLSHMYYESYWLEEGHYGVASLSVDPNADMFKRRFKFWGFAW